MMNRKTPHQFKPRTNAMGLALVEHLTPVALLPSKVIGVTSVCEHRQVRPVHIRKTCTR